MSRTRMISLFAAALGAGYCFYLLVGFLRIIAVNGLEWDGAAGSAREHYLAVGEAYSKGFVVGFFLCFFLAVIAFVWWEVGLKTPSRPSGRRLKRPHCFHRNEQHSRNGATRVNL